MWEQVCGVQVPMIVMRHTNQLTSFKAYAKLSNQMEDEMAKRVKKIVKLAVEANLKAELAAYQTYQDSRNLLPEVNLTEKV